KRNDKIKEKRKRRSFSKKQYRYNLQVNKINWIEHLLQTPIEDCRKQCLWRILCPYLINIRKLTKEVAFNILNKWLEKCDVLRPLDFKITKAIDDNLKNVKQFLPPSKDKLKDQNKELYQILKTKNIFAD
ncbi:MAG TPA: DNA primase noncatalytic subunit PriX, partial [Candidatus Sulfopaludibacter sp.]|nr:DNA primase noncatalytic subunit PriX [Candidatus Sulfopaludibacter sp.]